MAARPLTYVLELGPLSGREGPGSLDAETVLDQVDMLARRDERYLRRNPRTSTLYLSGVRWIEDPPLGQFWRDVPAVLRYGSADCKSIAAWYLAERRILGLSARPIVIPTRDAKGDVFHVGVETPDGRYVTLSGITFEDPSRVLGMG